MLASFKFNDPYTFLYLVCAVIAVKRACLWLRDNPEKVMGWASLIKRFIGK